MSLGGGLILLLSAFAVYGMAERLFQPRRADLVVGARDFTEGQILAEIVKQQIEAHTGLRVEVVSNLPTSVSLKALKNGAIDVYPEYTGNLLTNKEGLDLPVPADRSTITPLVRQEMQRALRLGRAGRVRPEQHLRPVRDPRDRRPVRPPQDQRPDGGPRNCAWWSTSVF